ncbi:oligosaccharide flippase family protein [Rhodobacteraceae bacterium NNCM2]|nr:oligosaccharide flippase family protein [Coraliihabitans acroporae]
MIKKVQNALRDPGSLTGKAIKASMWSLAALVLRYPLRLASNLIMVRILAPEAFGLMATVTVLHLALNLFSDIGIMQSVMRSDRGEEPRFLRIVWSVQIIRGFALSLVLVAASFAIQVFGPSMAGADTVYADPRLPLLLYVSTIVVIAKGFGSTNTLLARRRMQLGRITFTELATQVFGIVAMIGFGLWLENVWALLAGMVASGLLRLVLSHTIFPGPRMGWVWDGEEAARLWTFGKWLIFSSIGGFFASQGDRLVFSALIDKELLGIYAIAVVWIQMGQQLLQKIAGAIFIPSFSTILRERPGRIGPALKRSIQVFSLGAYGIFLVLALLGGVLIDLLYPPIYEAAKVFVPLLAFQVLFMPFLVLQQYLTTLGLTRDIALMQTVRGIFAVLGAYGTYQLFGMEAAVLAFALGSIGWALMLACHDRNAEHLGRTPLVALALAPCLLAGLYWALPF